MFEHPGSSQAAKLIGMFSIFCVFVSTVILTLDTLPFFQVNIKTVYISAYQSVLDIIISS